MFENVALSISMWSCVYRYLVLNGKQLLMMQSDTQLPVLKPVRLDPGSKVTLSPLTFGFFVFPEANVKICAR